MTAREDGRETTDLSREAQNPDLACNGLCMTAHDIGIEGYSGIAHAHPQCPLHSWSWLLDPVENEEDVQAQRSAVQR